MAALRGDAADIIGGLLNGFHANFDPIAGTLPEQFLLLTARHLVDSAVRLVEAVYVRVCIVLSCAACSAGESIHSLAPPSVVADRTEELARRLRVFIDLIDSAIEPQARQEREADSPLLRRKGAVGDLRHFAEEIAEAQAHVGSSDSSLFGAAVRELAAAGDDTASAEAGYAALEGSLHSLLKYMVAALGLVPDILLDSRRLPGLAHSWSHDTYRSNIISAGEFGDVLAFAEGNAHLRHPFARSSVLCEDLADALSFSHSPTASTLPPRDFPYRGAAEHLTWHGQSPRALLERIAAAGHTLSYTHWAVRSQGVFQKERCDSSVGLFYDPSICLEEEGWGGLIYYLSPQPKENGRLYAQHQTRSWRGKRLEEKLIWEGSMEPLMAPPKPMDLLVLSPMTGNCKLLHDLLSADSTTTAKLVYAPFNPALPPPLIARPNFTQFWQRMAQNERDQSKRQRQENSTLSEADALLQIIQPMLAQCSLAALAEDLKELSYELVQVDHHFAVFAHWALAPALGIKVGQTSWHFEEWRLGWFCSPVSRYYLGLEAMAPFDLGQALPDPQVPGLAEGTVCAFLERHDLAPPDVRNAHGCIHRKAEEQAAGSAISSGGDKLVASADAESRARRMLWSRELRPSTLASAYQLERQGRATCHRASGVCDCLVPLRGPTCSRKDEGIADAKRAYRGAIHYIVNDEEEHVQELLHALQNLYEMYNRWADYPVLIFHDGLSLETRERIALRAPHRLWFFLVGGTEEWLPAGGVQQEGRQDHVAGYRAQSRFRSGPLFAHRGTQGFDYLWGLDSDSHLPAPVDASEDPFMRLHEDPNLVMGYHYITKTSPASSMHFWDYTELYAMERGLDVWPGKGHFLSKFTVFVGGYESARQWNTNVVMTDCEILRASFFRQGSPYWDYYSFLDSVQGFERYRWGDHAVRGLGVGLALQAEEKEQGRNGRMRSANGTGLARTFKMEHPYAHQSYCHCGRQHCQLVHDPKAGLVGKEFSTLRTKFWTCVSTAPIPSQAPENTVAA